MSSTYSYIHTFFMYRHIFICPLLFIENSLAKDEVASMIPWLHGAFVHRHQDSVGSNESSDLKIKAWENLHRSANASQIATRHKLCAAVNGRKPAMRFSERVHPTADLTPAPHKMCNKLLKFARLFKFSTCRNISKACTGESAQSIPAAAAAAAAALVREPVLRQLLPHVPLITTCSIFLPQAAAAQPLAPSDVNHQAR